MDPSSGQSTSSAVNRGQGSPSAERRLTALTQLLQEIAEPGDSQASGNASPRRQNELVQVRLGIASSLFIALRSKHAPTASHCMRVALGCASWCTHMDLDTPSRDEIEVAALLHDVGKIGVPDHVLLKPGKLTADEAMAVERHRRFGVEILQGCCSSQELLNIVQMAGAWYDGSRHGFEKCGQQLPLGARMISIVDAFDSMTTDVVYRRGLSSERAVAELFECAGTQFDPLLVADFCELLANNDIRLSAEAASRWLQQLHPEKSNSLWRLSENTSLFKSPSINDLYHLKLLESMHDGVVFVDSSMKIIHWNRASERLTGISSKSVFERQWSPDLIDLRDEQDQPIDAQSCPLALAIDTCVQMLRRLTIRSRDGKRLAVDAHMVPVFGTGGTRYGGALLLHDASSQITLEERVQSLHHRATSDPLTKVANRAEFDRVHTEFVSTHLELELPCSLIICDIDHFKKVNDTYGHANGDEALREFARMLKLYCRSGDLVARYGGEEFVMLCADCDIATATERAEEIRQCVASTPQDAVNGNHLTASFGVTELQVGDTADTMLRRADRALYMAKEKGRNRVVQLGSGSESTPRNEQPNRSSWWTWLPGRHEPEHALEAELLTPVPMALVVEKIKGFVSDHHAQVDEVATDSMSLIIDGRYTPMQRRTTDRAVAFYIQLQLLQHPHQESATAAEACRTHVLIRIKARNKRDRRNRDARNRAGQLLSSLQSYLMAHEAAPHDRVFLSK